MNKIVGVGIFFLFFTGCSLFKDYKLGQALRQTMEKDAAIASYLTGGEIRVMVKGKKAIIWGSVCNQNEIERLSIIARNVPGIQGVDNRVGLKDCGSAANPLFLNPFE